MTIVCLEIHTVLSAYDPKRTFDRKLVSIGMATDDGQRFYVVNGEAPIHDVCTQLPGRVWKALPLNHDPVNIDSLDPDVRSLTDAKAAVAAFLQQLDAPEFWSMDGQVDQRHLMEAFDYHHHSMFPEGFPYWISSVREHRAKTLESVRQQNPDRFTQLLMSGEGSHLHGPLAQRSAYKNAHRTLLALQRTHDLIDAHELPAPADVAGAVHLSGDAR
ncbi:hypothetical protein ACFWV1_25900 [Streptomyces sp. NPDC058700]|uniref:hypothetical protein n=1 Tax=Streptomyces sp. NPDC058700 TaxID=3346607 RepID=UPI0036486481